MKADSNEDLTAPEYWDTYWQNVENHSKTSGAMDRVKWRIKRIVGESRLRSFTRNYANYVLWEQLYPKHLPRLKGAKVLEIGSAPGHYLVRLSRTFGCIPFGVEYARGAFERNREVFLQSGLDPDHVVFADAFSESYQARFRGFFDVVLSRGVIEHFSDPGVVIKRHLELLKPGGRLVISIPNYRGANHFLKWLFAPRSLKAHNLAIMRKTTFEQAFRFPGLQSEYCGHYGICDLSMCVPEDGSHLQFVFEFLDKLQVALNGLFYLALRGKRVESRWFSPFLLFVGTRTSEAGAQSGSAHHAPSTCDELRGTGATSHAVTETGSYSR